MCVFTSEKNAGEIDIYLSHFESPKDAGNVVSKCYFLSEVVLQVCSLCHKY